MKGSPITIGGQDVLPGETKKIELEMQAGDVTQTYADTQRLEESVAYRPSTSIEKGVGRFVDWFREYTDLTN